MAPLYDILDQVLGQSSRPGEGLSGKPVEVVLPFEEPELGASGGRRGGRGKQVYGREKPCRTDVSRCMLWRAWLRKLKSEVVCRPSATKLYRRRLLG